jgi:hypothetical protein
MRGLSKEVFLWLIDNGYIASVYERREIKQAPMVTDEGVWEEPPPIVREFFNIAFPVYREVTPNDDIPEWAGARDFIDAGHPPSKLLLSWREREEMRKRGEPSIFFYGMHIPWTDSKTGRKHWRYNPKGCIAQPYIIGDVSTADLVVIAESTWDMIAYIDLRKLYNWKRPWCAIATRGAGNAQRIPTEPPVHSAKVRLFHSAPDWKKFWNTSSSERRELPIHHSLPYLDPDALECVGDWMKRRCCEPFTR